jgi:hypothetical protein
MRWRKPIKDSRYMGKIGCTVTKLEFLNNRDMIKVNGAYQRGLR